MGEENVGSFAHCLSELKRSQTEWRTVVLVRLQSFNLLYMPIFRAFMFYLVFLSLFVQVLYIDSSFDELVVYARTVSVSKICRFGLFTMICLPLLPGFSNSLCIHFWVRHPSPQLLPPSVLWSFLILSILHPNIITRVPPPQHTHTRKLIYLCCNFEIYNGGCCFYL